MRTDVTDQIANGNTIDAIPLDQEFDAITSAFTSVSGHRHNGSVGEGAPITVVGPVQDLIVSASSVTPKTDNTLDLGAVGKEFKDLYITGVANIDSLVADTVDISAGTVDDTSIGTTTPSTGAFTTLSSSGAATLASATVGGVAATTASNTQTLTGKTINLADNTLITTSAQLAAAVTDETGTGPLVFGSNPSFTGIPTTTTAAVNTNNTQIASTAFVVAQIADDAPTKTGGGASGSWTINAATATLLQTPRTVNGTLFSGAADIVTTNWGTPRLITIGSTAKTVDGSVGVSWSLADIGAQAVNAQLTGLSSLPTTPGIVVETTANTFTTRTIGVAANTGVTVANGDGVASNPTISGVTQLQATWDAVVSTTESVISPAKLAATIVAQNPLVSSSVQNTTAGSTFTFTGVPATARRITVMNNAISLTASDFPIVQLGTSGGFVVTGYLSSLGSIASGGSASRHTSTVGFVVGNASSGEAATTVLVLTRMGTGNTWLATVSGARSTGETYAGGGGSLTLGGTLTQVRLTQDGASTFDAGSVSIMWE